MKHYLKIADLIPPAKLDAFMRSKMPKGYVMTLFEKYKEYERILAYHSMNPDQFAASIAMLHAIFECLEKALNEQANA